MLGICTSKKKWSSQRLGNWQHVSTSNQQWMGEGGGVKRLGHRLNVYCPQPHRGFHYYKWRHSIIKRSLFHLNDHLISLFIRETKIEKPIKRTFILFIHLFKILIDLNFKSLHVQAAQDELLRLINSSSVCTYISVRIFILQPTRNS